MANLLAPKLSYSDKPVVEYGIPVETVKDYVSAFIQQDTKNRATIDNLQVLQSNIQTNPYANDKEYMKGYIKKTNDQIEEFASGTDFAYGNTFVSNIVKDFQKDKGIKAVQTNYAMRQQAIAKSDEYIKDGWSESAANTAVQMGDAAAQGGIKFDKDGNVVGGYFSEYKLPKYVDISKEIQSYLKDAKSSTSSSLQGLSKTANDWILSHGTETVEELPIQDLIRMGKAIAGSKGSPIETMVNALSDIATFQAKQSGLTSNGVVNYFESTFDTDSTKYDLSILPNLESKSNKNNRAYLESVIGAPSVEAILKLPNAQREVAYKNAKLNTLNQAVSLMKDKFAVSYNLTGEEKQAKDAELTNMALSYLYKETQKGSIVENAVRGVADIYDFRNVHLTQSFITDELSKHKAELDEKNEAFVLPGGDQPVASVYKSIEDAKVLQTHAITNLKNQLGNVDLTNREAVEEAIDKYSTSDPGKAQSLRVSYQQMLVSQADIKDKEDAIRSKISGKTLDDAPFWKKIGIGDAGELEYKNVLNVFNKGGNELGSLLQEYENYKNSFNRTSPLYRKHSTTKPMLYHDFRSIYFRIKQTLFEQVGSDLVNTGSFNMGTIKTNAFAERAVQEIISGVGGVGNVISWDGNAGTTTQDSELREVLTKANPNSITGVINITGKTDDPYSTKLNVSYTTGTGEKLQHHNLLMTVNDGGALRGDIGKDVANSYPSHKGSTIGDQIRRGSFLNAAYYIPAYNIDSNNKTLSEVTMNLPNLVNKTFNTVREVGGTKAISTPGGVVELHRVGSKENAVVKAIYHPFIYDKSGRATTSKESIDLANTDGSGKLYMSTSNAISIKLAELIAKSNDVNVQRNLPNDFYNITQPLFK